MGFGVGGQDHTEVNAPPISPQPLATLSTQTPNLPTSGPALWDPAAVSGFPVEKNHCFFSVQKNHWDLFT